MRNILKYVGWLTNNQSVISSQMKQLSPAAGQANYNFQLFEFRIANKFNNFIINTNHSILLTGADES